MQVWNVLCAARWKYRTQKSRQKSHNIRAHGCGERPGGKMLTCRSADFKCVKCECCCRRKSTFYPRTHAISVWLKPAGTAVAVQVMYLVRLSRPHLEQPLCSSTVNNQPGQLSWDIAGRRHLGFLKIPNFVADVVQVQLLTHWCGFLKYGM